MAIQHDLHHNRRNYTLHELTEQTISPNPFEQFAWWYQDATKSNIHEPNAMTLATATAAGQPSARIVLLKFFDENGFVFYTNYLSRKGREAGQNPQVALLFFWDELERQVRIEGRVEKIEAKLSEQYFEARPYESQLSAIVSEQSAEIPNRQVLEEKLEALRQSGFVKRPEHWGGYVVKPHYFEFWQGRASRLHDRIVYVLENGAWRIKRLAP